MVSKSVCVIFILVLFIGISDMSAKSKSHRKCKKYYGCKYSMKHSICLCKSKRDCRGNPFKFDSLEACKKSVAKLKGACKRMPCVHGKCTTAGRKQRKFLCDCTGTYTYGRRCHKPCPDMSSLSLQWLLNYEFTGHWQDTPLACIM